MKNLKWQHEILRRGKNGEKSSWSKRGKAILTIETMTCETNITNRIQNTSIIFKPPKGNRTVSSKRNSTKEIQWQLDIPVRIELIEWHYPLYIEYYSKQAKCLSISIFLFLKLKKKTDTGLRVSRSDTSWAYEAQR